MINKLKIYLTPLTSTHVTFIIVALTFGILFIKTIPPLWGVDETAHFARSYQISQGKFLPQQISNDGYGGLLPSNLIGMMGYVYGDLKDSTSGSNVLNRKDVNSTEEYNVRSAERFSDTLQEYGFPGAAAYSPFAYPAPSIGIALSRILDLTIGQTIFVSRIFSLLAFTVIVALSLWILRNYSMKWLFFIVALSPMVLFQASIVTADNILIACSILFAALYTRLLVDKSQKMEISNLFVIGLFMLAVLLPLIKINYIFLSFMIFALPYRQNSKKTSILLQRIATLIFAVVSAGGWTLVAREVASAIGQLRPDKAAINVSDQLIGIFINPLNFLEVLLKTLTAMSSDYIINLTGSLGWNFVNLPLIVLILLIVSLTIAMCVASYDLIHVKKYMFFSALLSLLGMIGVIATLYITFTPVGKMVVEGVHGRYFIPFLLPVFLAIALLLPSIKTTNERDISRFFIIMTIIPLIIAVAFYIVGTY